MPRGRTPKPGFVGIDQRTAKAIRSAKRVPITVRLRGVDPLGDATEVTRRVTLRR